MPPRLDACVVAARLTAIYQGRGAEQLHRPSPGDPAKRLVRQIAMLGFNCRLTPAAAR
jgi:hypothetical protein